MVDFARGRRVLARLMLARMMLAGLLASLPGAPPGGGQAAAQSPPQSLPQGPDRLAALVISSDRGGALTQRGRQIRALRATGRRVELRGTCLSACTLYLALPGACVAPGARFGFHGPNWRGQPLPPREFERWSRFMAEHYREPLRGWFLRDARHEIRGYRALSGAELIRMGYAPC